MRKITLIFLLMTFGASAFGEDAIPEDALKAAFIFHFIEFTQWDDNKPDYYVCIPADEDLRSAAQELFKGKRINNRDLIVVDRTQGCHVLVSNGMEFSNTTALTIGLLDKGAVLEFRLVNNKMKFAIDMERMRKAKIKISSQLLKLAILENRT
jgi:hypothetical protein